MKIERILFIAPHSFPIFSSESIVNAKLAFTLAQAGYKIDIYSSINNNLNYPTTESESILLNTQNIKLNVIKFNFISRKNSITENLRLLIETIIGFIRTGHIYIGSLWGYNVISELNKKIKKDNYNYDIIITRGFKAEIVGIYLAKHYNAKWIANWNDPYPESKFPKPYGKGYDCNLPYLQKKIIYEIQKYSTYNTFPCIRLKNYMLMYMSKLERGKTCVIPHLAHSRLMPNSIKVKGEKLRIIHAGNVASPRNPDVFLLALKQIISDEYIRSKIECIFVGKQTDDFIEKINKLNLSSVISVLPSLDYFSVIEVMSKCDVSLIIEAICEEGIYLPTKVVDSFQCKLPIFCVSPPTGTLNDLINEKNIGYFSNNCSSNDVEIVLKRVFNDWEAEALPQINENILKEYFENEILFLYKKVFNSI